MRSNSDKTVKLPDVFRFKCNYVKSIKCEMHFAQFTGLH